MKNELPPYKRTPVYTKSNYGNPVVAPEKKLNKVQEVLSGVLAVGILIGGLVALIAVFDHFEKPTKPVAKESPYGCLEKIKSLSLPAADEVRQCGITFKSTENSSGDGVRGTSSIFSAPKCDDVEALGLGKDQTELDSLERLRRACVN